MFYVKANDLVLTGRSFFSKNIQCRYELFIVFSFLSVFRWDFYIYARVLSLEYKCTVLYLTKECKSAKPLWTVLKLTNFKEESVSKQFIGLQKKSWGIIHVHQFHLVLTGMKDFSCLPI